MINKQDDSQRERLVSMGYRLLYVVCNVKENGEERKRRNKGAGRRHSVGRKALKKEAKQRGDAGGPGRGAMFLDRPFLLCLLLRVSKQLAE